MRRQGLTVALLQAAVAYARAQGARVIEGYPVDPGGTYTYVGSPATFQAAGFHEVDLPHLPPGHRRLMRYVVDPEAAR